jgi:L-fucose mutarotase/ribose pyranase (RbsD/FucU family)
LYRTIDDHWQDLAYGFHRAIHQGYQTNELKVEADGPHISLYVNGQLLETVTDSGLQGGQVGVIVTHWDYQDQDKVVEVRFDNIEVKSLTRSVAPTSTPTSTLPLGSPSVVGDGCQFMHVMELPDTVDSVATTYGLSREELAAANNVQSWRELAGQGNILCIPSSAFFIADSIIDPTPVPGSGCRFMHVVRDNDDWDFIRMRYGVSRENILEANDKENVWSLETNEIYCIP